MDRAYKYTEMTGNKTVVELFEELDHHALLDLRDVLECRRLEVEVAQQLKCEVNQLGCDVFNTEKSTKEMLSQWLENAL